MSDEPILAVLIRPDNPFADELVALAPTSVVKTNGFDGVDLLTVLLPMTASIVPAVVKIVTKSIEARQHVVVKYKGLEIRGISEGKLSTALEQLVKRTTANKEVRKE